MATRLLADFSGQLNASGVGFATSQQGVQTWSKCIVTARAPNSPAAQWLVGIGDNSGNIAHLLAAGIGQTVSCGPYTLAPGEVLVVSVTGGGASDTIRATLYGLQDVDPGTLTMDTAVGSQSSVVLNGGTAVISISGTVPVSIAGAVTVTGTVAVSGTVTVNGTVSISGTVAISGTVTVNGTVSISGAVTISGNVTFLNSQIGVINASGTKITSSRPPVNLGYLAPAASTNATGTYGIPADIQGLVLVLEQSLANYAEVAVSYWSAVLGSLPVPIHYYYFSSQIIVIPILPFVRDIGGNLAQVIQVYVVASAAGYAQVETWALFEPNPLWLEYFAPPFAEPNQMPGIVDVNISASLTWYPIIAAAANIMINLFNLAILSGEGLTTAVTTKFIIGHGPNVGAVTSLAYFNIDNPSASNTDAPGPGVLPFTGSPLPRGDGLYIQSTNAGGPLVQIKGYVAFSLS